MKASKENKFTLDCPDLTATDRLATLLARSLPAQSTLGLNGTLGAGKTQLVRSIVAALGGRAEDVVSPTFVLCQHYQGERRTIHHLDAYRIADDDEFLELGVDELFDSDDITVVEWSERVQRCLPSERLDVRIEITGPESREIQLQPKGERFEAVARDVADHHRAQAS